MQLLTRKGYLNLFAASSGEVVQVSKSHAIKTESDRVQILVNVLGNRLDLRVEIFFNIEHVALVIFANKVDRQTKMTESA